MTRTACQLIVHVGTICLSWRSIKSLKRPSNEMNIEILQLWSLLALHKVYVRVGLEYIFSWFPFYYYLKMILLIGTFFPGSKFPNFWFETVLVPAIEKIYIFLDFDWIGWTRYYFSLFPFQVLDLVFVPGLLSSEEALIVKKYRTLQLKQSRKAYPITMNAINKFEDLDCSINFSWSTVFDVVDLLNCFQYILTFGVAFIGLLHRSAYILNEWWKRARIGNFSKTRKHSNISPCSNTFPNSESQELTRIEKKLLLSPVQGIDLYDQATNEKEKEKKPHRPSSSEKLTSVKGNVYLDSPAAQSLVVASSHNLRRFSRNHLYYCDSPESNKSISKSENNETTSPQIIMERNDRRNENGFVPFTCYEKDERQKDSTFIPPYSIEYMSSGESERSFQSDNSFESGSNLLALSPFQSCTREASETLENNDVLSEYLRKSSPTGSRKFNTSENKYLDLMGRGKNSEMDNDHEPSPLSIHSNRFINEAGNKYDDDDESMTTPSKNSVVSRTSLSDSARHLVTGDQKISVRDYLFNLSVPTPTSPHVRLHNYLYFEDNDTAISPRKLNNGFLSQTKENRNLNLHIQIESENKTREIIKKISNNKQSSLTSKLNTFVGDSSDNITQRDHYVTTRRRKIRSSRDIAKQMWHEKQSHRKLSSEDSQSTHISSPHGS